MHLSRRTTSSRAPTGHASIRRALRLGAALPLLAVLGGCGPTRDQFAPACPAVRPLPEAEQLHRYRDPGQPGGRAPSELVVSGQLLGAGGKCRPGEDAHSVRATMRVQMQLDRGPAAPPGGIDVPYFIAVATGPHILTKQVFTTQVTFPASQDQVTLTSAPIGITLPIAPSDGGKANGGKAYTIWVGFQLTPAEFTAETTH
ncbi:MAG: hypothetical protein ACREFY_18655 [Acetobacteraceae bacterium]